MRSEHKEGGREGGREGGTCWGLRRHQMTVLRPTIMVLIKSFPARRLSFISTLGEGGKEGGREAGRMS